MTSCYFIIVCSLWLYSYGTWSFYFELVEHYICTILTLIIKWVVKWKYLLKKVKEILLAKVRIRKLKTCTSEFQRRRQHRYKVKNKLLFLFWSCKLERARSNKSPFIQHPACVWADILFRDVALFLPICENTLSREPKHALSHTI